jgi:hypothetical protein
MQSVSQLNPFKAIGTGAAVWVVVGVPVAAMIAAFRVIVWVIYGLPEMSGTAAVLGAVHGLWLYLAGRSAELKDSQVRWQVVTG